MPDLYGALIKPLLFRLARDGGRPASGLSLLGTSALRAAMAQMTVSAPREVLGIKFPNAAGLAAGFDKNALVLPAWESLGFGFIEGGTITAKSQPGNPQPRLFRVPEHRVLINRMGFNNDGADAVARRLASLKESGRWPNIPVGINIGKSKVTELEDAPRLSVLLPRTTGFRGLHGDQRQLAQHTGAPPLQAAPSSNAFLLPSWRRSDPAWRSPCW